MHPRAQRVVSFALSLAFHALILLDLYSWSVVQPASIEDRPMPVRIIEPPARPAPPPQQPVARPPAPPPPPPIEEPPPPPAPAPEPPEQKLPIPEQQIVSPPDAGRNEAPEQTRFLSDRDTRVEEQMVKRGEPAPGESVPGERANPEPPPRRQPPAQAAPPRRGGPPPARQRERLAALPTLDRLMPDALQLAEEGYGAAPTPGEQLAQADRGRAVRPRGADGLLIPSGPIGTLDFLPDVREGDITLLNTKAEVFAPFVRRVALRVFQNFWISLKRDLVASSIPAAEQIEAEVVMSPAGELVGFTITQRSARIALATDRRLQQACNDGFFDRNPPPGARAADGRIHFIFRTAVQSQPSPRGTAYWVQLEAGLL